MPEAQAHDYARQYSADHTEYSLHGARIHKSPSCCQEDRRRLAPDAVIKKPSLPLAYIVSNHYQSLQSHVLVSII